LTDDDIAVSVGELPDSPDLCVYTFFALTVR